ncbi:MAG: GH3 auxin-responsive promoter family protein, partial [Anaeroplasmataceae bacterium]|nr:GH3 auxin-responsive promoter family protein [Anaeroplasmataceae bacterium]
ISTSYGKRYQFEDISSGSEYQNKVPISSSGDYTNGNESVYPLKAVLHTTGTIGHPKIINITEEALERYQSYIYDLPKALLGIDEFISVHTGVFDITEQPSILSTIYYDYLRKSGALDFNQYVEKEDFLFSKDRFHIPYVKLRLALIEENLNAIESIYIYEIDVLLEYLYENWKLLLNDIKRKECSIELSISIRKKINLIACESSRISYLENIFERYKGKPPLDLIWPKMKYLSGIGQRNAYYVQRIKNNTLSIPIYYFAYASSECMCGIATKLDIDEYVLLPQSAFYEFIDEKQNRYLPTEVKIGEKYELLITTFTGLYRYQTNDLLCITGFEGESPRFKVLGRKNKILNIAGEKVDEWTIHEAMHSIITLLQLEDVEYFIGIDTTRVPFGYALFTNISISLFKEIEIQLDKR